MFSTSVSRGYTLIELCLLLVLFALLSSLAVPSLSGTLGTARARSVLNRLTGDIHLARALATREGRPYTIRFYPVRGCADRYEVTDAANRPVRRVTVRSSNLGVCLESNVPRAMQVNARGMLIGSARKIRATSGRVGDSVTISMVGRVYRWQ